MMSTEPVGLLHVLIVYERPSAHRVVCHARSVSLERGVFLGDSVLPVDSPPGAVIPPARVVRMHRQPFREFTELPAVWSAVVELEGPDLSWVQLEAKLRAVPPATGTEQRQAG
ncbi:hypothetical protein [Streptomyces mirabilis]|jgi:hypothetical protein|uniref:Uncharacterized protein n=1 Tax=Streptomyces mirabilis TaxID=68239 RepID=A0A1I2XWC8_9ACTN|nr:hypothetical protein [Streptomyces mirabilis]SFH17784.1 hypothetical protein SAMN02787118_15323 [Streptomyces mirabilis]